MIDALVTGRSLPALQAALDLAEVGLRVAVAAPSGLEGTDLVSGGERDAEGAIAAFLRRIAEPIEGAHSGAHAEAAPVFAPFRPPMLEGPKGGWLAQPSPEVLGVPAVPISAESIALIGGSAATRAYLDRVKPLLTVGKTREFGRLVRTRMGAAVLDRLVEPQVFERYGVVSDDVDAAIAVPGLNEALSRAGSLGTAVLAYFERHVARETRVAPLGGNEALRAATLERLAAYGVTLLDARVVEVEESLEGWSAVLESGDHIESRALIADQGRSPRPFAPLGEMLDGVLPGRMRLTAEMRVDRPDWLEPGALTLARRGRWAVCVEAPVAVPQGDAAAGDALAGTSAGAPVGAQAAAAVRMHSGVLFGEQDVVHEAAAMYEEAVGALAELVGASVVLGESWAATAAETVAAPFATMTERDAAQVGLDVLVFGRDTLLPVGRALHGDDLGAALEWSQSQAIALRRRLLGLDGE